MSTSEIAKLESLWRENPQGLTFAPLAEAYRKMKEPQRALDVLAEGLARRPDYIPASIVLGRCHLDLGDDAAAETAFSRVLELDGENVIALKALAEITERHLRFDEAEGWLRQLLAIDRSNDEARAQLTRVEDSRRNAIGVIRDDTGAAAETMTGEMLTMERPAEPAAPVAPVEDSHEREVFGAAPFRTDETELDAIDPEAIEPDVMEPAAMEPDAVELDSPGAGHDFEPVAEDPVHIAFDTASPLDAATEDVVAAPLEGMEHGYPEDDDLLPSASVEHADELELQSSGAGEFQSPDAAADLIGSPPESFDALEEIDDFREQPTVEMPAQEAAEPEWTPMSADQEITADSWAAPESAAPWPELEAAPEPPAAEAPPEVLEPAPAMPEPEPVVTESMAELYLQQGHPHEALAIYRELYLRQPDDDRLRDRVADLEAAAAPAEAAREAAPDYSAGPDGRSVAAMFRDLLAARPAAARGWSPVAREESAPDAGAPASGGEPTRPADDRLSLSAVFGDDSSPVPPAMPAASAAPTDGMSFDAFFDAAPQAAEPAPRRAATRDDDDLEQFHAWLQNLKR